MDRLGSAQLREVADEPHDHGWGGWPRIIRIATLLIACSIITCAFSCTARVDEPVPAEATGTTSQAVGEGTNDTSNTYNYVPAVGAPGFTKPDCSGVLLTPVWVATANHCITGDAVGLISRADLTWTSAAEGSRYLQPGMVSMISLSTDGTTVLGALARFGEQIQPVVRDRQLPGDTRGLAPVAAAASAGAGPGARSGFGSVLSGTEASLFVVGGTLASGKPAGDLWRFDIWSQSWQPMPLSGPTPDNVLAATYVPETRSLYYLDERVTGAHQARLVRYDLATYQTTVLGAWPRTPEVDHVFLTTNDDGLLVLAGSSSRLNYVAGVVLHPDTHSVTIAAGFYHTGRAAFAPVLTEEALTIAIRAPTPTGVEHVAITTEELFSQTNPKKGNGKAWGKLPGPPIDLHGVL